MGVVDACHTEYGATGTPIVTPLTCSLDGQEISVQLAPSTRLRDIYGVDTVVESTTCNYGLNPDFGHLVAAGLVLAGADGTGEVRAVERSDHPFFVATLYQPQLRSTAARPHPVFGAFVAAVAG